MCIHMELNSNSWYIKFYLFLHGKVKHQLPKDICSLRNQLIKTAILLLLTGPLWIAIAAFNKWVGDNDDIEPWNVLLANLFLSAVFLVALIKSVPGINSIASPDLTILIILGGWYIGSVIFAAAFILTILALYFMIVAIIDRYKKLIPKKQSSNYGPGLVKTMYKSWKEKYCTKITWK